MIEITELGKNLGETVIPPFALTCGILRIWVWEKAHFGKEEALLLVRAGKVEFREPAVLQ